MLFVYLSSYERRLERISLTRCIVCLAYSCRIQKVHIYIPASFACYVAMVRRANIRVLIGSRFRAKKCQVHPHV